MFDFINKFYLIYDYGVILAILFNQYSMYKCIWIITVPFFDIINNIYLFISINNIIDNVLFTFEITFFFSDTFFEH